MEALLIGYARCFTDQQDLTAHRGNGAANYRSATGTVGTIGHACYERSLATSS